MCDPSGFIVKTSKSGLSNPAGVGLLPSTLLSLANTIFRPSARQFGSPSLAGESGSG